MKPRSFAVWLGTVPGLPWRTGSWAGYTVLEAGHGVEALDVARRHGGSLDLLLTDVVMPKMGGPELAERLVALQPKLKVLYMSGYTERAVVQHGVLDPAAAHLQKPVTIEAVAGRVREVLDSRKDGEAGGPALAPPAPGR